MVDGVEFDLIAVINRLVVNNLMELSVVILAVNDYHAILLIADILYRVMVVLVIITVVEYMKCGYGFGLFEQLIDDVIDWKW